MNPKSFKVTAHKPSIVLIATLFSIVLGFSQQITVNNNVPLSTLIQDNLVDGCVEITNIRSTVNGIPHGLPSFGRFERGNSNFPFESGIILSTGNAASAGNTVITDPLSETAVSWGTDPDIENALNVSNTANATSIEFDFTSAAGEFRFNYLFASEEYGDANNTCNSGDGFVFLIREAGSTAPFQNIAVLPNTGDPIQVRTIRNEINPVTCPARNQDAFGSFNSGDTNFDGRTTVLTASTAIIPYTTYNIKLIIADQPGDGNIDSAVFIEGDSFKILDLGEDINTCDSAVILNADIGNPDATYRWFLNNTLISGETNATFAANTSGSYRAEITVPLNDSPCTEEDEIIVNIQNTIELEPLDDFEMCDDNGDTTETFDLSTRTQELSSIVEFASFRPSYHLSRADAETGANPINAPIQNTTASDVIFIRVEDSNSGCVAFSQFNIIVNTLPNVSSTTLPVCDSDNNPVDGFTTIDLTSANNDITNNNPNLSVDSFHFNPQDAESGSNAITNPVEYINRRANTETLNVRVRNINSGCINTTTLVINLTSGPIIDREPFPLDACEPDDDGIATFNLETAIDDILDGLDPSAFNITFHTTPQDARAGNNPIADQTNYQNEIPDVQTIFVRVESQQTGCPSIAALEIHPNLLLTGTDTGAFGLCSDDGSTSVEFNLLTVEGQILSNFADDDGNIPANFEVNFFETEDDLNANAFIDKRSGFEVSERLTTLIITVSNTNTDCTKPSEIVLRVDPRLQFPILEKQSVCDRDDDGTDGQTSINLESFNSTVTGDRDDFSVLYFENEEDAEGTSMFPDPPLPPFYVNTSNPITLYARIISDQTSCIEVSEFEIEVIPPPVIADPTPLSFCEPPGTTEVMVSQSDIDSKLNEIVTDPSSFDINIFNNLMDADDIDNIQNGSVTFPSSFNIGVTTVYIRVENTSATGDKCFDIATLEIIVNTEPVLANNGDLVSCEDDGDGIADFIFAEFDAEILGNQTGKEVLYFSDVAETQLIDKNVAFQNTSSMQTIYVRIENVTDRQGCSRSFPLVLRVAPNPIFDESIFTIQNCLVPSEINNARFNLLEKTTEIQNTSPNPITISYFLNPNDAAANVNPITTNLESFNTSSFSETLTARIESANGLCFVLRDLNLVVIEQPEIDTISPLAICDNLGDPYDNRATFNLEDASFEILNNRFNNIEVQYFENLSDINENDPSDVTNAIQNINTYESTSRDIQIRAVNTSTQCTTLFTQRLEVVSPPLPNTINTPVTDCFNDSNTYDLSLVDALLINDPATVNITYHSTPEGALTNTDVFVDNQFTYTTTGNTTIHANIQDITNPTACSITTSFVLSILPNPVANTPTDLIECDDDFDNRLIFDLSRKDTEILGATQNASNFSVTYHNTLENANTKTDALNVRFEAESGTAIFARVENNSTGCFSTTTFNLQLNALPVIPIEDVITLCLDDLPLVIDANTGNPNDSYLWQTNVNATVNNSTDALIRLTDPSQIGTYTVTVTTDNSALNADNCSSSKTVTVRESQQALINVSTTTDFTDPNSITVEVSGIGDYVFSLDGEEPQESGFFPNVTLGRHIVTVIDLNGCTPIDTEVFVIDIPKFFTPNNDGFFDSWHIVGARELPGSRIHIFDRYGKLLKMLTHASPGWNGTFNGQPMPTDDYWFVADIVQDTESFTIKGHFTLKR
jgi:gliding motility-associated-like protein